MKPLFSILVVILLSQSVKGQAEDRVGFDGVSVLNLESRKIALSDSYNMGGLNYPRANFSLYLRPLNFISYGYPIGYCNYSPAYPNDINEIQDPWLYHSLLSGCQVGVSDPCGALIVLGVYSVIYALEKRRKKKKKAKLATSQ